MTLREDIQNLIIDYRSLGYQEEDIIKELDNIIFFLKRERGF